MLTNIRYSEITVLASDMTQGDTIELERLLGEAGALRTVITRRRGNVPACRERLRAVERDAKVILQRYA